MAARRFALIVIWVIGSLIILVLGGLDEPRTEGDRGASTPSRDGGSVPLGIDRDGWLLVHALLLFTGCLGCLMFDGRHSQHE